MTKASREWVGRKRNSFEGSKLSGVGRDSTSVSGYSDANPASHVVMDTGPKVANRRRSPCAQISHKPDPTEWERMYVPERTS